ncbi:hypothetical protein J1N35_030512 [Gossypium stocksii]|uniref:Uncharacterized protein n=1 Tax=Gossypium stocksii TaxID=47602 RepID=A0A9D3V081_9ROSI|nr:hypothetical protein J1N35_030512 [Gossypium stocksii]
MPTLMTCLTSSMLSALTDALMLVTPSLLWYWLASWLPFATLNFSPNSSLLLPSPRFYFFLNDKDYHGGFKQGEIEKMFSAVEANYEGWVNGRR